MIKINLDMRRTVTGLCVVEATMEEELQDTKWGPFKWRLSSIEWQSAGPVQERQCLPNLPEILSALAKQPGHFRKTKSTKNKVTSK